MNTSGGAQRTGTQGDPGIPRAIQDMQPRPRSKNYALDMQSHTPLGAQGAVEGGNGTLAPARSWKPRGGAKETLLRRNASALVFSDRTCQDERPFYVVIGELGGVMSTAARTSWELLEQHSVVQFEG